MVEQAFRVAKGSPIYNDYFEEWAERKKFHTLAQEFFTRHDLMQSMGYYIRSDLALQLTDEQREKYAPQLKKLIDRNNVSYFKKNSPMYKDWQKTVVSKINFGALNRTKLWYWGYINKGSYTLWHYKDELYGYLSDDSLDELSLPDCMEKIKMSEYYTILEKNIANFDDEEVQGTDLSKPTVEQYQNSLHMKGVLSDSIRCSKKRQDELLDELCREREHEKMYLSSYEHHRDIVRRYEIYEEIESNG